MVSVSSASESQEQSFNWSTHWYPITFLADLPSNQVYAFSIFAEPLVIFRDGEGELVCLADQCSHQLAKLSDGQIIDGKLECLYHGWQFGKKGSCLHIPQLSEGAKIPDRAKVKAFPVKEQQGMIWVWADAMTPPIPELPPRVDELEPEAIFRVDTVADFPFDHTFLVENLLDPAHVYISHDGTELGIHRKDAQPLEMEVSSTSLSGIEGRFRRANNPQAPWTSIKFDALTMVHYSFSQPAYGVIGGLALYALPVAYGRSRVLIRRYGNFFKRSFTLKPRWLEHLRQNKILEEDLAFIVEQDRFFHNLTQSLKEVYFPIKTCDTFVMEHRRWLDRFGQDLPWYVGYATAKSPPYNLLNQCSGQLKTRFERHTLHCQTCLGTYQLLNKIKLGGQIAAVASLCLALVTENRLKIVFTISLVIAVLLIVVAKNLKIKFE